MDDFPSAYGHIYKKIENGTVLPIIPPSSGIRKENKNVYLHSDQVFGDAETLSL